MGQGASYARESDEAAKEMEPALGARGENAVKGESRRVIVTVFA